MQGFLLEAVQPFQIRTLSSMGFQSRVVLSNKSHQVPEIDSPYRVDVTVVESPQKKQTFQNVAKIQQGQIITLETHEWWPFQEGQEDVLMIFHLIPIRWVDQSSDKVHYNGQPGDIFKLVNVQDNYIEYYREDGYTSGVLYSSVANNYKLFGRNSTTLIQAPKVYLSKDLNTYISLIYNNFGCEGNDPTRPIAVKPAILRCSLSNEIGESVIAWEESLPAYRPVNLDLRSNAEKAGIQFDREPRFYNFTLVCKNATVLPLTLNHHIPTNSLAIEHSLPPLYYGKGFKGLLRSQSIGQLWDSKLFKSREIRPEGRAL